MSNKDDRTAGALLCGEPYRFDPVLGAHTWLPIRNATNSSRQDEPMSSIDLLESLFNSAVS